MWTIRFDYRSQEIEVLDGENRRHLSAGMRNWRDSKTLMLALFWVHIDDSMGPSSSMALPIKLSYSPMRRYSFTYCFALLPEPVGRVMRWMYCW